jgi:hypothetical protein
MSAIGSIPSVTTPNALSNARSAVGLTGDQKNGIKSVLSNFDSKNITASDAKKISSEFSKLGIQPGRELQEAMAAEGFDAKQVGDLAFGQGQQSKGANSAGKLQSAVSSSLSDLKSLMSSVGRGSSESAKSDQEIAQAADAFLQKIFAKSADSRTSKSSQGMPEGNPPPPPPSVAHENYKSESDVESYMTSLMSAITSGSDSAKSGASTDEGMSQLFDSASTLLNATGIEASAENLQSFMQILQKNIAASMEDKGNVVDQLA